MRTGPQSFLPSRAAVPCAAFGVMLALLTILPATAAAQWGNPGVLQLNEPAFASQYCEVSPETDLEGFSQYTLEAWVYPTSYSGVPTILGNNYKLSWWLGLNPSGKVRFYPIGGGFVEGNAVVPLNQWTHVAATYQQGVGWAIYVNGQLDQSGASILGAVGTSPADLVYIGADRESVPSYFWRGYLDEVRIWSVRRTGVEIRETMFIEVPTPWFFAPGYSALEAVWDFQVPGLTYQYDRASGIGRAVNLAYWLNGASVHLGMMPPLSPGTALRLNGVDDYAVMTLADGFSNGVTIEAWVAPLSWSGYPTIAGRGYQSSFWLGLNPTGHLRFYPTGGIGNYVESVGTVPIGRWSHVAATYHNGITTFYLNGKLDSQTGAITGPVGENGANVHLGADNPLAYFFNGYLDEIRITRGARPPLDIRRDMYIGYSGYVSFAVPVEGGMATMSLADIDGFDSWTVIYGSGARYVKSGAALGGYYWASAGASEFYNYINGGEPGAGLPDGTYDNTLSIEVYETTGSGVAMDPEVFVSAPVTDLSKYQVTLRSPMGTTIDLVGLGAGRGRDIHTVFRDWAPGTLASGLSPYIHGVQPTEPLATFNLEPSEGYWRISFDTSDPSARVDIWAWGIRFGGIAAGVGDPALPQRAALRMAGAHPVRGQGSLAFDLPGPARVDLRLIDVQGRVARTLYEGESPGGTTTLGFSASGLAPGVYTAVLEVDGQLAASLKVTLVR